jgi:methyl-accepting chemotaxis protein WspA
MTIRTKFAFSSGLIVVLALIQLAVVLMLMGNQNALARAQDVQHESWRLSDELRYSSDELTRTARTYVVTGDPDYETEYWRILAVRNGESPRPDGRTVALRSLMEEIGFTGEELGKLTEAEDNSNDLVATETAAFQAMLGRFTDTPGGTSRDLDDYTVAGPPDQALAIRIMHDAKYHQDKDRIMRPIAESERLVESRTLAEVERLTQRSRTLIIMGALIGLVLVTIVVLAHLLAQRPVLASTNLVRSELSEIASGAADLSKRLSIRRNDELGALATAMNRLMERLEGLIRQILQSGIHVNAATTKIAAGTRGLEATVTEQVAATNEVVASAQDISATSADLTQKMGDVCRLSEETAAAAARSRQDLETMAAGMSEIENASKLIGVRLRTINDKAKNIANVVTTITRVSEQTNLLSLNAAIEAEKAGQYGQGFSVVAREIRRLADQTALATIDIEKTVDEMRSAVDGGVSTIEQFSQRVRSAAASVNEAAKNTSRITEEVQALAPTFETVLRGMENQSQGAKQISETMVDLSETTRETARAISDSKQAIDELNAATAGLQAEVKLLQVGR